MSIHRIVNNYSYIKNSLRNNLSIPIYTTILTNKRNVSSNKNTIGKGHDLFSDLPTTNGSDETRTTMVAFGDHAFQINNTLVRQSVILLPTSFLLWKANRFEDIHLNNLLLFSCLSPTIEILLIGCGGC